MQLACPVAWKGHPRSGPVQRGQMLFGTLLDRSGRPLRLRATDVRVLDRNGRSLVAPGATAPLSVSWKGEAAVVEVAGARLTLH